MGFLTVLKKMKQKEKEMRILLLGLDNAGKTTILKRFNGESIDAISPTLGFNIKTLEHNGYTLNIWDVGGQKSLRSYWRNYFECTDGLVWVVDSADRMRLETCKQELEILLQEERLAGATLLVLANKQDLPGALSANEIKEEAGDVGQIAVNSGTNVIYVYATSPIEIVTKPKLGKFEEGRVQDILEQDRVFDRVVCFRQVYSCDHCTFSESTLIKTMGDVVLQLDDITTHHWLVVGVSAVTGEKLLSSVDWLIDDIAKRIFTLD